MVNQVRCFIGTVPFDVLEYCLENGIIAEAYSPIATGALLKDKKISDIAKKYGVSIPRLCVRYVLQLGAVVLPKTTHKEFMVENSRLDFKISADDMELLKGFRF